MDFFGKCVPFHWQFPPGLPGLYHSSTSPPGYCGGQELNSNLTNAKIEMNCKPGPGLAKTSQTKPGPGVETIIRQATHPKILKD